MRAFIFAALAVVLAVPVDAQDLDKGVAAYELGLMYELGRGVIEDRHQAAYWFQQGALAGHGPSQEKFSRFERYLR